MDGLFQWRSCLGCSNGGAVWAVPNDGLFQNDRAVTIVWLFGVFRMMGCLGCSNGGAVWAVPNDGLFQIEELFGLFQNDSYYELPGCSRWMGCLSCSKTIEVWLFNLFRLFRMDGLFQMDGLFELFQNDRAITDIPSSWGRPI